MRRLLRFQLERPSSTLHIYFKFQIFLIIKSINADNLARLALLDSHKIQLFHLAIKIVSTAINTGFHTDSASRRRLAQRIESGVFEGNRDTVKGTRVDRLVAGDCAIRGFSWAIEKYWSGGVFAACKKTRQCWEVKSIIPPLLRD